VRLGETPEKVDPIIFSIIQNSLKSIVDEMNNTLFRSASSAVITEGRDIGGAIFDRDGHLVSQGTWDLAVFVGMLEFSCAAIIKSYENSINPGDVFIMNDPYVGGTHFNDVGVIRPTFFNEGLFGFVAIVGHWPDVGGAEPGSFAPDAEEYYKEGLRIPPIKIMESGRYVDGVIQLILSNVRNPEERRGDIEAQIAAVTVGESRLKELIKKYGLETLDCCLEEVISYSERLLRAEFGKMRDGDYEFEDFLDMESRRNPRPVRIHLKLTINEDEAIFDFSNSDPPCRSATNSTFSATASALFVATKSLFPEIPMNHGCFVPIKLIIPQNTVVNVQAPTAMSAMASSVYEKVVGVTLGAFAQVVPDKVMACPYNLINLTIGGTDPLTGLYYVAYLYSEGGFGGRATKDGNAGLVSLYGGGAKITPVEVFERKYPIMFKEWTLEANSGGPGTWRGGVGSKKSFILTRGVAKLTALGDREKYPPWGLFGGRKGGQQLLILNEGNDKEENLTLRAFGFELQEGNSVTIHSGGGGGYGNPFERDPELVARDVRMGYVTVDGALKDYGVVVDDKTFAVDVRNTQKIRSARKIN
jgi:N-methylhydantoinase B